MHLRRLPVVLTALLLAATVSAQTDRTDDFVKAQLDEFHLPGMSVAVIRNGEIVKADGYGFADVERKIPATRNTVYKIGSVSKQFLAAGIMTLVQDDRIRLDDPVAKYLEDTPPSWASITVRHLLTHTSGLVRESPAFDWSVDRSDRDLVAAVHRVPLRFTPGDKWEYCNVGYFALADIIRIVTRQPWTEYLHQKIFAPAGMTATVPTNTTVSVPNRAVGYTGNDNRRKADEWRALRASGAFLSTVTDLAKWDALLHTNTILSDASRREMWTQVRLNDGKTAPYGLGWHVQSSGRRRRIWHGGGLPGFTSHFVRFVDDGLTVVVLANGDDSDMASIANGIASLYLPASTPAASRHKPCVTGVCASHRTRSVLSAASGR